LVLLDTIGNKVLPDGTLTLDRPVFGARVAALLDDVLGHEGVTWVVVVTGTPLLHGHMATAPTAPGR
jgi:hypothetical protein